MAHDGSLFAGVEEAVAAIRAGQMVVVVDDEDRENEGDLTLAAEFVTPEAINFMARFGRGLICLTLTEERADYMRLGPMTSENTSRFGTAFTESVEAREGVTTGISAADRAHTIKVAIDPSSTAHDLARPGHVFPLRARKGGVLVRAGQTEASVDLARMAGLVSAGVICEIMNEDGTMARVPDLVEFCKEHKMLMVTVADLIRYRLQHERYIHRVAESVMATEYGEFRMIAYENEVDGNESHVALVMGDVTADVPVPVRVHTHSLAEDVFGLVGTDNREVIDGSLRMIGEAGRGALIYLHNGTRGFGVDRTVEPHRIVFQKDQRGRERGDDHTQRTLRQVGLGGQILSDLGIRKIKLLTNTPTHVPALQGFGIEIVEQVPITVGAGVTK
ncbi:3,4-dihydroxy-2-butanone-4-phosphate synthase [Granulicella tundricola]|uniref:3,4-dihydroxy-2-butanone 4-phosphate synthase n=1 Tax=Granulicella tundricola (strain ATCC BAA-1859 / DSM 23138 / MP5ACTX9) TaxID=1198114 RepID=E8WX13_GRATM|nr:3,4-dihydroxy-2-butanone-4-phosphate synthase [Granulicella tundricola]ADW68574.1 3,4-dihydroxy-2-butanone 4-phosphate synthase [Granulicella tundricola MP5ACTX9]